VMADNFLVMYVGWEGVGLCSYLLIGFWFERKSAADAGKKAFLVNRVGDFGFALAIMLIFATMGTLDFAAIFREAPLVMPVGSSLATAICLLLFMGATGKSAQIPLYVWLPDAMEGPTPVSALIHAATMVTAGVYMVARTHALFELSPVAMTVVAAVGVATAFFAATIALVQTDIKRLLAYSTISQLGYMFVGVGAGAYASGMFHLTTHAFFKALLFLGAGSVMHALAGELDLRKMGRLKERMPTTYWTFLVGAAALAGFPLLSGFFSKDEILWNAFNRSWVIWLVGLLTAFLTAVYSFRAVFLAFWGQPRDKKLHQHAHESPPVMTVPLIILAVLALIGGVIGLPHLSGVEAFLEPVFEDSRVAVHSAAGWLEWVLLGISALVAVGGTYTAYRFYVQRPQIPLTLAREYKWLYTMLCNKYYVDEFYMAVLVNPLRSLAGWLARFLDTVVIDGAVNGLARLVGLSGEEGRQLQTGYVATYALSMLIGVVIVLGYLLLR